MFDKDQIKAWEYKVDLKRFDTWKTEKLCKDPARERLYKRRKHYVAHWGKENTWVKKRVIREYRKRNKIRIKKEEYEMIPPFVKTSGWETW